MALDELTLGVAVLGLRERRIIATVAANGSVRDRTRTGRL
jgi:hypothetical protein